MHVFPAQIPQAEAHRADIVEVRVARKVASLFGLGSEISPFRRSWVCDYTALSLAEIGRGAPNPDRVERSRLEATKPSNGEPAAWLWSGRAVWSPQPGTLPGALSNATLNRYGPDTKAAVVLAAANRLLRDSTLAVAAVGRHLAGTGCDVEVRLAIWAGLVLEVYRAQPALVVAAIQARDVQRSLSARWGAQVDRAKVTGVDAPSEIHTLNGSVADHGGPEVSPTRWRPTSFDLIDLTLPALGLSDDMPNGTGLVTADALDDIASAWCHRLLGVGRPGRGVVWLSEDGDGSRRVHAMVRVGAVVAPFVAAVLGGTHVGTRKSPPVLPMLPDADTLAAVPVSQRRAHLLTAHVAASYVRYRDELLLEWPQLRVQTRDLVDAAARRCAQILEVDDPVPLQLAAYAAYLDVWDRSRLRARAADRGGAASLKRLIASQERVLAAWQSGRLDPGAAAYLLEIGIVALRDTATSRPSGSRVSERVEEQPTPSAMQAWWAAILEARGLAPEVDLAAGVDALSDAQVFHLHHYAAWLARGKRRGELRRALALQERVVAVRGAVTRREPAGFAAKSAAARAGHELGAEIATDLAAATPEREHGARAQALAAAVNHARAVLSDPSTDLLRKAGARPETLRAARIVARALCAATSSTVTVGAEDAAAAVTLIDSADRDKAPGGRQQDKGILAALRGWRKELVRIGSGV